jgi:hypothetical protein
MFASNHVYCRGYLVDTCVFRVQTASRRDAGAPRGDLDLNKFLLKKQKPTCLYYGIKIVLFRVFRGVFVFLKKNPPYGLTWYKMSSSRAN